MEINILRFDSLDSTNTEAAKHVKSGADEGLCIIARQQTAGRGRLGRTWVSKPDAGLYFSIILRPKFDGRYLPLITLMAGVAVHDTLAELGIKPDIKWVNDVLVDEKKISGILAETFETDRGIAVILGIGINLSLKNLPAEITDIASSIHSKLGFEIDADGVAAVLTKYLDFYYKMLSEPGGPTEIREAWRQQSSYFSGKPVRVSQFADSFQGVTDGIEENGALRVKLADGSVRIVQAGDVERLRSE